MFDFEDEEEEEEGQAEPQWISVSRRKLKGRREGNKSRPPPENKPARLNGDAALGPLPAFKNMQEKEIAEVSAKSLPGHWSGANFPHNVAQLKEVGPEWYTQAFHKFGTLPADNSVTQVLDVRQLDTTGVEAAGGAGHKAIITVEYEKPDPKLHTQLFAKMPWPYTENPAMRVAISGNGGESDARELWVSAFVEHLFPCKIPKLYFCDFSAETTNWVLITECILFGKQGRIEDGKVVEKVQRQPYEVLPIAHKYQDYLLESPGDVYTAVLRIQAQLAGWDCEGRFDAVFGGPKQKITVAQYLEQNGPPKAMPARRKEVIVKNQSANLDKGLHFATEVAPKLFSESGRDPAALQRMKDEVLEAAPHFADIVKFLSSSSDYVGACHMNLQPDNAFFWHGEAGDLDAGALDWAGFGRHPIIDRFKWCMRSAEADVMVAHKEGFVTAFCEEYERYGGPHVDPKYTEILYDLTFCQHVSDVCQFTDSVYKDIPEAEFAHISSKRDPAFVGKWNARCRGGALINVFDLWPQCRFINSFRQWKDGVGKPFITPYG